MNEKSEELEEWRVKEPTGRFWDISVRIGNEIDESYLIGILRRICNTNGEVKNITVERFHRA